MMINAAPTTVRMYQGPRDWLSIRITHRGDTKFVAVFSRLHVTPVVQLNHCYSDKFSDAYILNDIDLSPWL